MGFKELLEQEESFLGQEFFGPVFYRGSMVVRVMGVLVKFTVLPANFVGWGVFQSKDGSVARLKRRATTREINSYLGYLPYNVATICQVENGVFGIVESVNRGEVNHRPIRLSDGIQLLDTVDVALDGANWIFKGVSRKRTRYSDALRQALHSRETNPTTSGLTLPERAAYRIVYEQMLENEREAARRAEQELMRSESYRVKSAVEHGDGGYRGHRSRGNNIVVDIDVDGENHQIVVDKTNLGVVSAGICLNGTDSMYDLHQIVPVIREAQNRGLIYRM